MNKNEAKQLEILRKNTSVAMPRVYFTYSDNQINMWGNNFYLYETYKQKNIMSKYCDFKVAFFGAINEAGCLLTSGVHMPL